MARESVKIGGGRSVMETDQGSEVSDVNIHRSDLSDCQERPLRSTSRLVSRAGLSLLWRWVHMTGTVKYLTSVIPFVLIPSTLKNFQIMGSPA